MARSKGLNIEILIGKDVWTLGADRHNYIFGKKYQEVNKETGAIRDKWIEASYFGTLEHALIYINNFKIKNMPIQTFEQLQAAIRKSTDEIKGLYESTKKEDL